MNAFDKISGLFAGLLGFSGDGSLMEGIRLESAEDERTLALKDGTLVSVIRLDGAMRSPGIFGLEKQAAQLRVSLSPFLTEPGHAIEFSFSRDPLAGGRLVERAVAKFRGRAEQLNLEMNDIFAERHRRLAEFVVDETNLIAVYTRFAAQGGTASGHDGESGIGQTGMKRAQVPGRLREFDLRAARHLRRRVLPRPVRFGKLRAHTRFQGSPARGESVDISDDLGMERVLGAKTAPIFCRKERRSGGKSVRDTDDALGTG